MSPYHPSKFTKFCTAVVAAVLLQPPGAQAAQITNSVLAQEPLQGLNPVKKNILFTLDDSGSMSWDYLPDWTAWRSDFWSYCRDKRQCGGDAGGDVSTGQNFGIGVTSLPSPPRSGGRARPYRQIDPPLRSSDFNKLYYNPATILDVTFGGYLRGVAPNGDPLPCEGNNTDCTGPWTAVYMNGYSSYSTAASNTINLAPTSTNGCVLPATAALCIPVSDPSDETNGITAWPSDNGPWRGVPDTLWCLKSKAALTGADFLTADSDGSVCRRNGRAYQVVGPKVDAGYNYPNGTSCTASVDCYTNSVTVYGYPYYYTISNYTTKLSSDPLVSYVWFCDNAESGTGWGTGNCSQRQDPDRYKYVRYSRSGTSGPGFDATVFTRVDITPTGFLVNGAPKTNPSGRTYEAEMANFARWYAFVRTRILATKTALGISFLELNEKRSNVGFVTFNSKNASLFRPVGNFDLAGKKLWFNSLYAVDPDGATPTPAAMKAAGEYFSGRAPGPQFPGAVDPLDPDTGKCQANFHIMSTDGYWTDFLDSVGDVDGKNVPSLSYLPGATGLTPGNRFPPPYYDANKAENTLSDLAMSYWINDIRNLPNEVRGIAPWQHVNFYALALGAQGTIVYRKAPADPLISDPIYDANYGAILKGTRQWPAIVKGEKAGPKMIDDLWHATVNGRGDFCNPDDPREFIYCLRNILKAADVEPVTGSPVGIQGQVATTNFFGYLTSSDVGWVGDVRKYALDSTTGALSAGSPVLWSASEKLDAQIRPTGWKTDRRVVTINSSGKAVPFQADQLSLAQQAALVAGWQTANPKPTAEDMINYLRGDQSNETCKPTTFCFRGRAHALGDIVNSSAVPVGAPRQPYDDIANPGYSAFVASRKSRKPTVYAGANDGMLHAFYDCAQAFDTFTKAWKCTDPADEPFKGMETWAYLPRVLIGELNGSALSGNGDPNDSEHKPSVDYQLAALSFPSLNSSHKFYVNATPRIWDVDFANTNTPTPPKSGNDWRTILVGGLGAGGRAVYALDVTTPMAPPPVASPNTEAAAAEKVLWEFTDPELGYVYDAPTLVKTRAYGWVVLVASGYNNPEGKGYLYVLNPNSSSKAGQLLKKIPLPGDDGTSVSPTGLSTIRAFAPSRKDPYVLQAYGGDLKGNIWRFDLSSSDSKDWVAEKIATLKDEKENAQPITTGVRVEIDQNNNVDRYLFVGTGKLLGENDLKDASQVNTVYVIRDGKWDVPELAPAKQAPSRAPYSRADLNPVKGSDKAGFTGTAKRGWYQDGNNGEKVITDVYADVQVVVYSFSKPSADRCKGELTSNLFARDFNTGNSALQSQGGDVVASIENIGAIAGVSLIQVQGGATGASSGDIRVQVTTMKGEVFSFGVMLAGGPTLRHRVSWRLLSRD